MLNNSHTVILTIAGEGGGGEMRGERDRVAKTQPIHALQCVTASKAHDDVGTTCLIVKVAGHALGAVADLQLSTDMTVVLPHQINDVRS